MSVNGTQRAGQMGLTANRADMLKKDRQYTYNVRLRCVRATIVAEEKR